jgi:RNA polymerase sigma-70 factor (ECF subfamily)
MSPPPSSFETLLDRFQRPLIRYALTFTPNLEDARDIVQDTFVKLASALPSLDPDRIAPWLFTVCKNQSVDHHRKLHRLIPMDSATLELESPPGPAPSPSEDLEHAETATALHHLINQLPDRQREAVKLKFIAGLDYKQISQAMDTTIGNVGYLIHHGVQALRQKWTAQETQA